MNQTSLLSTDHTNDYSYDHSTDHSIEDIVLRHSARGMTVLQQYLVPDFCRQAAEHLLGLERGNILLTTGFCVAGHAETDGPPGTVCAAQALKSLGFSPVIVTDRLCRGLFEPEDIAVEYVDRTSDETVYQKLLDLYEPVCLISIERCGRNLQNDYANMRGISIAADTACIDLMFDLARERHIWTIGVGDGGNEIGMGNLREVISEKLELNPCTVPVDDLIIATTSNWGAYALVAYLAVLQHQDILPSYQTMADYLDRIVALGCVDGVTKQPVSTVDGFPREIEKEILNALNHQTAAEKCLRR